MKRSFKHWTPLYIRSRIKNYFYYRNNPDKPWLTQDSNKFLEQYLTKEDNVLEFGSGGSTLFFAKKCKHIVTFEHDILWYNKIITEIKKKDLKNIQLNYFQDESYYKEVNKLNDQFFDVVLVDGIFRAECTKLSLPKIKNGGILIIDNANWYLPNNSLSPNSKRKFEENNEDRKWVEVFEQIKAWRKFWTTNFVTDTLILFKPY